MALYLTLAYLLAALSSCDSRQSTIKPDSPIEQEIEDLTEQLLEETFNIDVQIDLSPEEDEDGR